MQEMTRNCATELSSGQSSAVGPRQGRGHVMRWVQERVRQLPFRLGGQEPEMPLGARVLVLKGETRNDIGQMAIISRIVGSQVEISYRGPTGTIRTRRKQRSSLIRMEDGVELAINDSGWPVIRPVGQSREAIESEEVTRVVSEGEERIAQ